jgi:hypothetical protein
MEKLREHKLYAKFSKCEFWLNKEGKKFQALATCWKEKKREERRKKVPSTSTCMFNVYSTFIYFCTLLLIVRHHWSELEVPVDISFACYCLLKFDPLILCTLTCYI